MEGNTMKQYSREFKEEALKLSDEIGVKNAAKQLGVAYYTLADWRSIRRNRPPRSRVSVSANSSVRSPNGHYRGAMRGRQAVCFPDHGLR